VPPIPLTTTVLCAATLSLVLQLRAEYRGPRWHVFLFKPLTTFLLVLLAMVPPTAHGLGYQVAICIGLACSLLGDVFLMLPRDRFVPGLASFLVAHVAYLVAFSTGVPIGTAPGFLLPLLAVAILLLRLLWPSLGRRRLPVLLYTATILTMVWQAWGRRWLIVTPSATLAACGAALFMVSDGLLALHRFGHPLPSAQILIMTTYVAAQAMIALSVSTP
jgi:uncharacterized membrane protein YhhN